MAKVYMFDIETREFLKEEDAFVEPVRGQDVNAINATLFPPLPNVPKGYVQVFKRGAWMAVQDHRHKRAFDIENKRFHTISQLGNVPKGHVLVDGDTEREYREHPDHFVVTETSLSKRNQDEIDIIDLEDAKRRKREARDAMLLSTDWKVFRAEDAIRLYGLNDLDGDEKIHHLAQYRQYLRDFTNQDTWWEAPILSLEEFNNKN
jgi:hypothetical protein